MQVCPNCHTTMAVPQMCPVSPTITPPHWSPTPSLTPGVGQPPYVCGRMFQVTNLGDATSTGTCHQGNNPSNRCSLVVPTEAAASCHLLCYLTCPHNCSNAIRTTTCSTISTSKLSSPCCSISELRNNNNNSHLHKSGGGLLVENEVMRNNNNGSPRSISPEAKVIDYPINLNPFLMFNNQSSTLRSPSPVEEVTQLTWTAAMDNKVILGTRNALEESGWYYGTLSWQQAASMLLSTEVGTFLIRDSASPHCLYSLSVQTINGPTSVRIHYSYGKFRLDCTGHSQKLMPEFSGLVELIEHYIHSNSSQVWVDHEGKTFSPIHIKKPFKKAAPSLQHLCRLAINCTFPKINTNGIPVSLKHYLNRYPHTC